MKKIFALLMALTLLAVSAAAAAEAGELKKITFCLDWTPNTNHTGVYAAAALGYYREEGLEVQIVQPPENGALLMCAAGQAQFAVDAQDTMAASLDLDEPLGVTAVAAILQHNTSGILSRKGDGITSAKGLENKVYATWDSPIELAMLRHCMEKEGADFDTVKLIPNNITDEPAALAAHQTDSVWIFYGWSGNRARLPAGDGEGIRVCRGASGGSGGDADRRRHHGIPAGFPGTGVREPEVALRRVHGGRAAVGRDQSGAVGRLLYLAVRQPTDAA